MVARIILATLLPFVRLFLKDLIANAQLIMLEIHLLWDVGQREPVLATRIVHKDRPVRMEDVSTLAIMLAAVMLFASLTKIVKLFVHASLDLKELPLQIRDVFVFPLVVSLI